MKCSVSSLLCSLNTRKILCSQGTSNLVGRERSQRKYVYQVVIGVVSKIK